MFLAASDALAHQVSQANLDTGTLYPPLSDIREVSLQIAVAVAEKAFATGLARSKRPKDLTAHIKAMMYEPDYLEL